MRTPRLLPPLAVVLSLSLTAIAASTSPAGAAGPASAYTATLDSASEVPVVLSPATGTFRLQVSEGKAARYAYDLQLSGLRGNLLEVSLQIGLPGQNGADAAVLCASQPGGSGLGIPGCPGNARTGPPLALRGEIPSSYLTGDAQVQGLIPGDTAAFDEALARGFVYVNVRTDLCPRGEIRGQLQPAR